MKRKTRKKTVRRRRVLKVPETKKVPHLSITNAGVIDWPAILGRPYLQDLQRERSMFAVGVLREQLKDRFAHMKEGDEFSIDAIRSACRAAWATADIMIEEGVKP